MLSRTSGYVCQVFTSLVLALLLGAPLTSGAESNTDWPQWRGPNRDDLSAETGLLQAWPEGGPQRLWLYENCGLGYAGPSIVGDRMFIMGTRGDVEILICLKTDDGTEVWNREIGPIFENDWGNGPRSTPTVDGGNVFALGAQGNLICVAASSGELHWTTSFTEDLGGKVPSWGFAESPLVMEDRVLCSPGSEKGGVIAALDRETGEKIWLSSPQVGDAHYSSIMLTEQDGQTIGVQLLEKSLIGFSPLDGAVHWSIPWPGRIAVVPTPIILGNRVYVTSGYGAGCSLIRLGTDRQAEPLFENKNMVNQHGGVILLGDHVYGYSEGKGWVCQEFSTLETTWREKGELGKGAIAYANNRFYCLAEESGEVALISTSTAGWEEHGRFTLDPQTSLRKPSGKIWVHPVISGGRLFLRDQEYVYCYDVRGGRSLSHKQ